LWTVVLCLLCTLPYWRALTLPLISDDYLQIWLGKKYLHFSTWPELAQDALYRCRATSIWFTGVWHAVFGHTTVAYNLQSLIVHACNVALIVALGRYERIGYAVSVPAAVAWGLYERHHEAVMWYAALPEQLVFFFVLLALVLWLEWWKRRAAWLYAASAVSFALALLSKESAVIFCAFLLLPLVFDRSEWKRLLQGAAPYFVVSGLYFLVNHAARENHLHWNDGTFRLGWHFVPVMLNSMERLLSVWGALALGLLVWKRRQVDWKLVAVGLMWVPVSLAPYSFVAYQPRVPSRHVYFASLGLAMLLALAWRQIESRTVATVVFAAFVSYNTVYLWVYKHEQFAERARVTEKMLEAARAVVGVAGVRPVRVTCFPLAAEIATIALEDILQVSPEMVSVEGVKPGVCSGVNVELVQQ
jgi:hypothetical protein